MPSKEGSPSGALNSTDVIPIGGLTALVPIIDFVAQYLAPYVGGQAVAVAMITGVLTGLWRLFRNYRSR